MNRLGQDALSVEAWIGQDEEREELRVQLTLDKLGRRTLIRSLRRIPAFRALQVELFGFIRPDVSTFTVAKDDQEQAIDNDPHGRIAANNEGRRAVWLFMQDLLRPMPETHAKEASDADR